MLSALLLLLLLPLLAAAGKRTIVLLVGESRSVRLASATWNQALFQALDVDIGLCNAVTEKFPDAALPRAVLNAIPGAEARVVFERPYFAAHERGAPLPRVNHTCPSTCLGATAAVPIPTRFKPQRVGNLGRSLDQARNLLTCYLALRMHEAATGVPYEVVVKMRLDTALWRRIPALSVHRLLPAAATHPAALFTHHTHLDYSGIADRFWMSNSAGADVLFTSGLAAPRFYAAGRSIAALLGRSHKYFCSVRLRRATNFAEEILFNHLRVHNVTVLREYFMDYNSLIAYPSGCGRPRMPALLDIFGRMDIDLDALKIDAHADCDACCMF